MIPSLLIDAMDINFKGRVKFYINLPNNSIDGLFKILSVNQDWAFAVDENNHSVQINLKHIVAIRLVL